MCWICTAGWSSILIMTNEFLQMYFEKKETMYCLNATTQLTTTLQSKKVWKKMQISHLFHTWIKTLKFKCTTHVSDYTSIWSRIFRNKDREKCLIFYISFWILAEETKMFSSTTIWRHIMIQFNEVIPLKGLKNFKTTDHLIVWTNFYF